LRIIRLLVGLCALVAAIHLTPLRISDAAQTRKDRELSEDAANDPTSLLAQAEKLRAEQRKDSSSEAAQIYREAATVLRGMDDYRRQRPLSDLQAKCISRSEIVAVPWNVMTRRCL
jgi:hypothetical protein